MADKKVPEVAVSPTGGLFVRWPGWARWVRIGETEFQYLGAQGLDWDEPPCTAVSMVSKVQAQPADAQIKAAERVRAFLIARSAMVSLNQETVAGVGAIDGIIDLDVADLEVLVRIVLGQDAVTRQRSKRSRGSRLPDGLTWDEVLHRETQSPVYRVDEV